MSNNYLLTDIRHIIQNNRRDSCSLLEVRLSRRSSNKQDFTRETLYLTGRELNGYMSHYAYYLVSINS